GAPNLNAYAERWVRSVKEECLSKVVLFGERSLRRALSEYIEHFHAERNHQGKGNVLLFPRDTHVRREGAVQCRERLGGLLRYYPKEAPYSPARGPPLPPPQRPEGRGSRGTLFATPLSQLRRFVEFATSYQLQVLTPVQFFDHTGCALAHGNQRWRLEGRRAR